MKMLSRSLGLLAVAALCGSLAEGQVPTTPVPQPLDIRVHVAAGGRFLDDLALSDFALTEDGQPLSPRSLTLIRNGQIVRRQGIDVLVTPPPRTYALLFQLTDWDPNLTKAVQHLFTSVLHPGDTMTLVTPFKPYRLQAAALALKSKAELSKGMEDTLRKDILRGGGQYRQLINDLKRLTKSIGGSQANFDEDMESDSSMEAQNGFGLEMQIDRYRQALMAIESIRLVDEAKLLEFAHSLKAVPGQKSVFFFYQREFRPEISQTTMTLLMSLYQDNPELLLNLMDLFHFYKREKTFNADLVKRAFADAGIDFHFIFMEKTNQRIFGATMREQSEDTYPGFVEIAQATGGTSASSANPAEAFKRAAEASSDYYLLTYLPQAASGPGFRKIEVQVKRPGCQVTNPAGYFVR